MIKNLKREEKAILSLVFGILILIIPSILSYLVAVYLIIFGIIELANK